MAVGDFPRQPFSFYLHNQDKYIEKCTRCDIIEVLKTNWKLEEHT